MTLRLRCLAYCSGDTSMVRAIAPNTEVLGDGCVDHPGKQGWKGRESYLSVTTGGLWDPS